MSGSFLTLSHGSAFFDVDSILSEGFLKDGKITTITAPNLGPILLSKRKKSVPLFSHVWTEFWLALFRSHDRLWTNHYGERDGQCYGWHSIPISRTSVRISSTWIIWSTHEEEWFPKENWGVVTRTGGMGPRQANQMDKLQGNSKSKGQTQKSELVSLSS